MLLALDIPMTEVAAPIERLASLLVIAIPVLNAVTIASASAALTIEPSAVMVPLRSVTTLIALVAVDEPIEPAIGSISRDKEEEELEDPTAAVTKAVSAVTAEETIDSPKTIPENSLIADLVKLDDSTARPITEALTSVTTDIIEEETESDSILPDIAATSEVFAEDVARPED